MNNRFVRKFLPDLIKEVDEGLNYLLWLGGHSSLQAAWLDEIRFSLPELAKLQLGIDKALNDLCYELDELAGLYWEFDPRETQCRAIIDEILDFQLAAHKSA